MCATVPRSYLLCCFDSVIAALCVDSSTLGLKEIAKLAS